MGEVEVRWEQQALRGGTLLERWHAHLVKPFVSREFAWLLRRRGVWHLEVMLGDRYPREIAIYTGKAPDQAMRHVQRWIAGRRRWEKLVLARGAEDPRGKFSRFAPDPSTHHYAVRLRELTRGHPCPFGGLD